MKNGWQEKRLSDVCEIVMGTSPPGETYNTTGEGVPLINGPVEFSPGPFGKTVRTKFTTAPNKLCKEDDLILCVRGSTTGKMNIAGFDACIGRGVAAIRAKEYQPWVNHFISSKTADIYSLGTGATFPNISTSALAGLTLLMPPLSEQRRIVGILDEAFEGLATAKANAEQNLQNARALFESHLQTVFTQRGEGWQEKRLDEIAVFSQGVQIGLEAQSTEPGPELVRFIRIIDYTQGTNDVRYVKDPGVRFWVEPSEIVMVRYGTPGLIGRGIEGVIANNLFKISPINAAVTNDFLAFFLGQRSVQDYLSSQGSSTMPALTFKQLGAVGVAFPPSTKEQNSIATQLDSLHEETQRLESLYQRKLAALDELKKSLLHRAFSGEL